MKSELVEILDKKKEEISRMPLAKDEDDLSNRPGSFAELAETYAYLGEFDKARESAEEIFAPNDPDRFKEFDTGSWGYGAGMNDNVYGMYYERYLYTISIITRLSGKREHYPAELETEATSVWWKKHWMRKMEIRDDIEKYDRETDDYIECLNKISKGNFDAEGGHDARYHFATYDFDEKRFHAFCIGDEYSELYVEKGIRVYEKTKDPNDLAILESLLDDFERSGGMYGEDLLALSDFFLRMHKLTQDKKYIDKLIKLKDSKEERVYIDSLICSLTKEDYSKINKQTDELLDEAVNIESPSQEDMERLKFLVLAKNNLVE